MNDGFPKKERERRNRKLQIYLHHIPDSLLHFEPYNRKMPHLFQAADHLANIKLVQISLTVVPNKHS